MELGVNGRSSWPPGVAQVSQNTHQLLRLRTPGRFGQAALYGGTLGCHYQSVSVGMDGTWLTGCV